MSIAASVSWAYVGIIAFSLHNSIGIVNIVLDVPSASAKRLVIIVIILFKKSNLFLGRVLLNFLSISFITSSWSLANSSTVFPDCRIASCNKILSVGLLIDFSNSWRKISLRILNCSSGKASKAPISSIPKLSLFSISEKISIILSKTFSSTDSSFSIWSFILITLFSSIRFLLIWYYH